MSLVVLPFPDFARWVAVVAGFVVWKCLEAWVAVATSVEQADLAAAVVDYQNSPEMMVAVATSVEQADLAAAVVDYQ
eukprot:9258444-Ditylum_brightwellii.AAC.1